MSTADMVMVNMERIIILLTIDTADQSIILPEEPDDLEQAPGMRFDLIEE